MRLGVRPLSLSRRIVASVALGLGLILVLFGLVALWTIQESTDAAYRERVTLAQALARRVGDVLRYTLVTLDREAASLDVERGMPLTADFVERLGELQQRMGVLAAVAVIDTDGRVVWVSQGQDAILVGSEPRHESVEIALRTRKPAITEIALDGDGTQGTTRACLAVPLYDVDGGFSGVLMAELDPDHPSLGLLPSTSSGEGAPVELVNTSGRVLASNIGPRGMMEAEHQRLLNTFVASRTAGYAMHDPRPWEGFGSHVVAYAPLTLLPSWGVVVEQTKDVVVAVPQRIRWRLGIFGLAALLLAAAVAWADVRQVVRPLRYLTKAAERFAAGYLDEPVLLDRADELGILARAFETMRQRLRVSLAEVAEWNRELERRVANRTAEVEALYESLRAREHERAELLQRVMAGQEEERRRLAQELHDETSQALASLQLGLERLAGDVGQTGQAKQLAEQLQTIASQTLADVHRLAVELRPSVLDDIGLVAAVERYLLESAKRWDLPVDFAAVGMDGVRLIPAAETVVYRIVQSALTNVVQHADAKHVSVLLERRHSKLVVVVEDDGRGFDLEATRNATLEKRLGLAGMDERAELIGAALTFETAPGAGTTVFLEVPIEPNLRREGSDVEAPDRAG